MIRISISKKLNFQGQVSELVVDAEIPDRSFTAIFGPSGSGKTSLLRIIAGLTTPERGIIEVDGKTWLNTDRRINLPPQQRQTGFVFQDYALFPNMTVAENILFACNGKDQQQVSALLELIGMTAFANQKPQLLSGGQKQRVALARALARKPDLLLLDEPLSALDMEMRSQLRDQLQLIHREQQITTLFVGHDKRDVLGVADQVIYLDHGRVTQLGTPEIIFGMNTQQADIQLTAEVIAINQTASGYTLDLQVGDQIITAPASAALADNLMISEKVTLSFQSAGAVIQKLS